MNEVEKLVDEKINEMLMVASIIDTHILKGRSMRDVIMTPPLMKDIPPDCVFSMDFKYEKNR